MTVGTRIQARRDTAANWASANPVLSAGECGLESDTHNVKYGDGTTAWNSLAYALSATYAAFTPAGKDKLDSANGIALMPISTALGNAKTALAKICMVGTSLTSGYNSSTKDKRFFALYADLMVAKYAPAGALLRGGNFLPCYFYGQIAGNAQLAQPATPTNGSFATDTGWGFGRQAANLANTKGFTWTEKCTSFDICYVNYPGGTLSVVVDGGSTLTINTHPSGAQPVGGKRWNSVTDGGLTLTGTSAHTITVTCTSATGVLLTGLMLYQGNETAGVQVVESGHYGWQASDWIGGGDQFWLQEVAVFQPHLITIEIGANEYALGTSSATMAANVQTMIAHLRAVLTHQATFQLIGVHQRGDTTSPVEPWSNYLAALATVAATDTGGIGGASGVIFTDLSRRLPTPGSTGAGDPLGLISADHVHYNDLSPGLVARALAESISPR